MACSICDHTVQRVADYIFWCPRCGSLKNDFTTESPMLIERVRELVNLMEGGLRVDDSKIVCMHATLKESVFP